MRFVDTKFSVLTEYTLCYLQFHIMIHTALSSADADVQATACKLDSHCHYETPHYPASECPLADLTNCINQMEIFYL
jgi:hypothetical protein